MVILLASSFMVFAAGEAEASSWPTRTVQIVAPYGPGGDTDFNARAYSKFLDVELGKPAIVANMAGSGGVTGSRHVKDSRPDGYTVLFYHTAMLVNELAGSSNYSLKDFEYVCTSGEAPGDVIVVRSNMGINTLGELIEYSKKNPGELTLAADVGTITHILALQLADAGAEFNVVSTGGAAERVTALKGGHIDIIMNAYGTVSDYVQTGEFKVLAVTSPKREEGFKTVPTALEQGYNVQVPKYYFFAMPKGTPKEIVAKFASAIENVSKNPEYAKLIWNSFRQVPVFKTAEEGLKDFTEISNFIEKYRVRFQ